MLLMLGTKNIDYFSDILYKSPFGSRFYETYWFYCFVVKYGGGS